LACTLAIHVNSAAIADLVAADLARAEALARQALAAAPLSPLAHFAKGQVLRVQRRFDEALCECETALASNRNWVSALQAVVDCKRYTGSIEDCIPLAERAIRLSPRDPDLGIWYLQIGMVHLLQSRTDEAVVWLERARSAVPEHRPLHPWLASAYALRGEPERAAVELAEARRLFGDNRYSSIARLRSIGSFGVPKIRALYENTYFAGLRLAGVPEE
jgi:adenylate cyclase